jgi:uncharacterized protein YutE (UPF0331/DUF86 family)
MTVNPDVVRTRCAEIEDSVQRLERFGQLSLEDFLANLDSQDAVSYRLLVAIEAALALCYHVSARTAQKAPEDYAACFGGLSEAGIIAADLAGRLQRMARFRNLLVHGYWKIDYSRVHAILQEDLADLRAFASAMAALL